MSWLLLPQYQMTMLVSVIFGQQSGYPPMPEGQPVPLVVKDAKAETVEAMRPYRERIAGSEVTFAMVPVPAGSFVLGSPEEEADRRGEEGPAHEVSVDAFWIGTHEVTWDEYHVFMSRLDLQARAAKKTEATSQDAFADAVSRPTPPYVPMDFGMGVSGHPAVSMTQLAAKQYTKWLSMKTGRFYRLPTEAEWEYACRAGTSTAFSFGDDPALLGEYGWFYKNSKGTYQKVGTKKPNPWGLFDMHGNVSEWVLDGFSSEGYPTREGSVKNPLVWPEKEYPRVVRGGSWDDDPDRLRSAARRQSRKSWKVQDPQLPKSIWYHTNASFVGLRVVRPFHVPPLEERQRYWDPDLEPVREVLQRQRKGER